MTTLWSQKRFDEAVELAHARRYRAAMDTVLPVLSVYPDDPLALEIVGMVLYLSFSMPVAQDSAEPLTRRYINDPRLDHLFCSCDAPNCDRQWINSRVGPLGRFGHVSVSRPRGGRCPRCRQTFCREHFLTVDSVACPNCRVALDPAAEPNGRVRMQTMRLNQPLVRVYVLSEGPLQIEAATMTKLLDVVAPDVFEDEPRIRGFPIATWPKDIFGLAYAIVTRDAVQEHESLSDYDIRVDEGYSPEDDLRWCIAKVFAKQPKWTDTSV